MYLEDVFTESEYLEIKNKLENRICFERKLKFGKYTLDIGLDYTGNDSYYIDLWGEPYMASFGYEAPNQGGGYGEKVKTALKIFGTYESACKYFDDYMRGKILRIEPKYQGIKKGSPGEQLTMF